MKQLLSERFYAYWADPEHSWTVRMTIKMRDDIDRTMMCEAVAATQQRYPYYGVRLRKTIGDNDFEYYALEENTQPWVVMPTQQPAILLSPESNDHLLAFSCWDDSIALDFFHALTDGTGAYNVLRTLIYEYCRRRYDSQLSREGIRVAGDDINPDEWLDPASLPRPESLDVLPVPPMPRPINLMKEAAVPVQDAVETVNVQVSEEQMLDYVKHRDTSPATLISLMLDRAIARLHPDSDDAVPIVALAINQRPALGTPLAGVSLASALRLPLTHELQQMTDDLQETVFRGMVVLQSNADNVVEKFWMTNDRMDQLDRIPTVAGRHQAMAGAYQQAAAAGTCVMSYVGKANFGAAERYICDLCTEVWAPYAITIELSAAGGQFCISWMQRFSNDAYLNAFIAELHRQGLDATIAWHRPLVVATVADYHNILRDPDRVRK